jgi:DNA polymerase I
MIRTALAAIGIAKVWLVDFEFRSLPGERPDPICMVAHELNTETTVRWWQDDLRGAAGPPYGTDAGSVMVAYYASAEIGCHLALGWPLPANVLDLYPEFRTLTNGLATPCGAGLLAALAYFDLPAIGAEEKESMRALAAMRGGLWTPEERVALLNYCASDAVALEELLLCTAPTLDMPRALVRSRYMKARVTESRVGQVKAAVVTARPEASGASMPSNVRRCRARSSLRTTTQPTTRRR